MRRYRLFKAFGLCVGLASGAVVAAEPAELTALLGQPPAPPTTPPTTTPPVRPTTPPATTPPGLTNQPTLAPVSSPFNAPPQSVSSSGAGFTPYMMGDLPATSYVCGMVCFPVRQVVTIPPVVPPTPPVNPGNPVRGNPAVVVVQGQQTNPGTIVTPGQTQIINSTACRYFLVPQVGAGAIKIEENESPRPMDRVYVTYNYFNDIAKAFPGVPGTDLHRETYGLELTFLGGDASIGLRMSSLQTSGGSTLAGDDFGDVTVIMKYALWNDLNTGNVVTIGMAVSAPTGPDAILMDGTRINPVFLQPFSGLIYNWRSVYVQTFSSIIVPTDNRVAVLGTASVGLGWWAYRSTDADARLAYLTPFVEGHTTLALNHRGLDTSVSNYCDSDSPLSGFPDTFVLTSGLHVGIGQRANLALGVGVPLTGPSIFGVEAVAQLNWRF
jgi:hypothetical protein